MACQTDAKRKGFTFIWILENFEYCWQTTGKSLKSPTFIVDTLQRTKWSLSIKPRGCDSDKWISLYLVREGDSMGSDGFNVDYEIAILESDGSVLTSQIEYKRTFVKNGSWGFPEFEKRETIFTKQSKFLPQGVLTLRCRMWDCKMKVKKDGLCIARTHIHVERRTFLWGIRKIKSSYKGHDKDIKIKSASSDDVIMIVKLYLKDYQDSLTIFIKPLNCDESIVLSTFKSYLVEAQGSYVKYNKQEFWFSPVMPNEECALSISKDMLMDNYSLYMPNSVLYLYCEYAYSYGVVFQGIEDIFYGCIDNFITNNVVLKNVKTTLVKKSDSETSDLKMDLNSLLQEKDLCDVKLCTGSETFPAHWIILSARSPVFRAMFKSNSKKMSKGRIDIGDLKPDTVRRLLHYIYTDSLEELEWDCASDLYVAAIRYQIMTLWKKCSSFFKTNLNPANASNCLRLADFYQDMELKDAVQDFILKNDVRANH